MSSLLTIKNLEKVYPNGVVALKGVSFNVQAGEFLVVIGLSGSGKSTLLKCINHLIEPTSGQILFEGKEITHVRDEEVQQIRQQMAMIFQNFNLIERHSVLSNVLMGALKRTSTLRSILGFYSASDEAKAMEYLKLVGIEEKAYFRASQLSGGQKQRVAVARALMQNPKILLADEPVASLDPATCHVVMDYLKKINRELGLTVICNLHFLSLVRQYASRVVALKGGRIVYEGAPQEIDEKWFEKIYGEEARQIHVR